MTGTKAGGIKAAETNKKRYGKDFYREMGRKGGKAGMTGGLYGDPERAKKIGAIGGKKSRRGLAFIEETATHYLYISRSTGKKVKIRKEA